MIETDESKTSAHGSHESLVLFWSTVYGRVSCDKYASYRSSQSKTRPPSLIVGQIFKTYYWQVASSALEVGDGGGQLIVCKLLFETEIPEQIKWVVYSLG